VFSIGSARRLYSEHELDIVELFKRDKPALSSEKMLHKDYDCKGSVAKKKKTLVVILKGLGAKTN
jgi:hypothetical protein